MTPQEGWITDSDGERVYVPSSNVYAGNWRNDEREDNTDTDYVYDNTPTVYTSKPHVTVDGAYWDERSQTLMAANPNELSDYHQRYIQGQMKAQARAALGINPNRYDGTLADDVLTGEVVTPAELGYDPLNVHRLINKAGDDEGFQQYAQTFNPNNAELQLTPEHNQILSRIEKQFGSKFQNSKDPGLVNRQQLLAFASYYGILPKQGSISQPQMYYDIDQSNIPEATQLKGIWGVSEQDTDHRIRVVDEILQISKEGENYATVDGVALIWDRFNKGFYDKQLQQIGRQDLIHKRYRQ
ncbi:MAG: hypothetical protein KME28_20400 [Pelatocladus maniniholoensis HA4357-MV3]|jgi:hypothetical protein|uniref:Uncharacterized protein n=1 Tax=Pelatocladus maniniholoensis HA4357-MV3 TaxID=1117104 RepID=A0A9E3HAE1_9NOST|nr:hypothetical protein [Pelatocladus maniniholoensis HA4357-MV3]